MVGSRGELQLDDLLAGFPLVWKDQLGHRDAAEGLSQTLAVE
jgi:hypothetical protein